LGLSDIVLAKREKVDPKRKLKNAWVDNQKACGGKGAKTP